MSSLLIAKIERGTNSHHSSEIFNVPAYENQTVLDVVSWIQQNTDPTLSYHFVCRVGMCDSFAIMVNGIPCWACRTHISSVLQNNKITIGSLRNLPVIKDLVVDMEHFLTNGLLLKSYIMVVIPVIVRLCLFMKQASNTLKQIQGLNV